jgi:uncharacterized sporulation protein YeaH/YhbH (DUF444 family)
MTSHTDDKPEAQTLVVAHDVSLPFPINEADFFTVSESGGTSFTAAYELVAKMIAEHSDGSYNRYVFHLGESAFDDDETVKAIENLPSVQLWNPHKDRAESFLALEALFGTSEG